MDVYAFVGSSGTGKSHRAQLLAHELNTDLIIDDGLIISSGHIISGLSSKKQTTRVGAIKTAIFNDSAQRREACETIESLNPKRVLILATSQRMAERIVKNLQMPPLEKVIRIEDVANPSEIAQAKLNRKGYGRHVVPAPAVEVKKKFSGTLIEPLQTWLQRRSRNNTLPSRRLWVEQAVVRPTFSYYGHFYIASAALAQISKAAARDVPGVVELTNLHSIENEDGLIMNASVTVRYGCFIPEVLRQAQDKMKRMIEQMTALNVISISLTAQHITSRGAQGEVSKTLTKEERFSRWHP